MKKKKKNIFIMFILIFTLALLGGCGTKADPAEISEHAMENFVKKINSGYYVVNAEGYLKTTAYSEDLVYFDYENNSAYTDFAVMSVDNGFYRVPASELGSSKSNGYINEDKGIGTAFDLVPNAEGEETYIYFEFKSGIDFETEGGDEGEGNHPILGSKHMDEFEEAH